MVKQVENGKMLFVSWFAIWFEKNFAFFSSHDIKIGSYDQEKKQKRSGTKRHINQIMTKKNQRSLVTLKSQDWKNSHMTIIEIFQRKEKTIYKE